jgi:hypothetical protein
MRATQEITPETIVAAPVVIVNTTQGELRMHAKGCADVKRDVAKAGYGTLWNDFHVSQTLGDYALDAFGDIASDNFTVGTPEHVAESWNEFEVELHVLPCANACLVNPPK